jgi:hypothetical protein
MRPMADFDGDVQRPSDSAAFHIKYSSGGSVRIPWHGRDPVPADYDGDRKSDVATFTDGTWWIRSSINGTTNHRQWGQAGDIAV